MTTNFKIVLTLVTFFLSINLSATEIKSDLSAGWLQGRTLREFYLSDGRCMQHFISHGKPLDGGIDQVSVVSDKYCADLRIAEKVAAVAGGCKPQSKVLSDIRQGLGGMQGHATKELRLTADCVCLTEYSGAGKWTEGYAKQNFAFGDYKICRDNFALDPNTIQAIETVLNPPTVVPEAPAK